MRICLFCGFAAELDDQVITVRRFCLCLRCSLRETGRRAPVPDQLLRDARAALDAIYNSNWIDA